MNHGSVLGVPNQRPSTLPYPAILSTITTNMSMRRPMNSSSVSRMPRAAVFRGLTSSAVIGATIKKELWHSSDDPGSCRIVMTLNFSLSSPSMLYSTIE